MAGLGFKVFSTGDVLTAVDTNGYLMQGILVFATATARDAAITSPSDGQFAYTTTTPADTLSYYNGAAWVAVDLAGDITGITTAANSSMSGGATSGTVTLTVDVNNTTSATATAADYVLIADTDDSNATKRALVSDITALVPQGDLTGLTAGTNIDITAATGPVPTITLGIDAAVDFGVDGTGVDVSFHSGTAGDLMFWDASEESLTITGTDGQNALVVADGDVSITDKLTVTGQIVTHLLVSTDSTTTHAPALGDENAYILTTHGTGITVTLPQDSAQAFAIGTTIYYERNGAGTLTFAAGTGASVTSKDSTLTCGDRYTTVAAIKIGTNAWSLIGNIG